MSASCTDIDPLRDERAGLVREVGSQAIWSLSSCKPSFGVDQLRDNCMETYWQSDGQLPHLVNIQFRKKTTVQAICIYIDYKLDESYTPSRISVRAGTNFTDLQEVEVIELNEPTGWFWIPIKDINDKLLRTFMIQIAVLCKREPAVLHHPNLEFFKEYIESLGGVVKPKITPEEAKKVPEPASEPQAMKEEVESEPESDIELDIDGVLEPDNDPPQPMGNSEVEVSEEDEEMSNEKRRAAMELFGQAKYDEAINAYTEAILLNPRAALLYAKRGQSYLNLMKPNACIRDCTRALEVNPDSAAAFKFRGRAHRLLGQYVMAAEDLRNACKIDYDEQADEWLKEVTPNAKKIEEHLRKYERKRVEKEVKETRERVRKMREEQAKARDSNEAKESKEMSDDEAGSGPDLMNLMKDPEVFMAFQDPEVSEAFLDISKNPANISKYKDNPKVSALLKKISSAVPGFSSGMPPSSGPFGSGGAGSGEAPPPRGADVDLD